MMSTLSSVKQRGPGMDLREFTAWGFDERGYSASTRRQYRHRLEAFAKWYGKRLDHASADDMRAWMATLPPSAASRNQARKALHAYGAFLVSTGRRKANPADGLPLLRPPKSVPKALDAEQAQAVYAAARRAGGVRLVAVTLLLYTGIRLNEARTLAWSAVEGDWMRVLGKGDKLRAVPVHPELRACLTSWRAKCTSPVWVLPSPLYDAPVSPTTIWRWLRDIGDEAGIERLHPHVTRHTTSTALLDGGTDVMTIAELLGHSSIRTTQTYLRVRPSRVADAVNGLTFSP